MKKIILLPAFVFLNFLSVLNAEFARGEIKIMNSSGTVAIFNKDTQRTSKAKQYEILKDNCIITTQAKSAIILMFSNGSLVSIPENSNVNIAEYKFNKATNEKETFEKKQQEGRESSTKLKLNYGQLFTEVSKLNSKSKMDLITPVGVAGIRGTRVSANVLLNHQTGDVNAQINLINGQVGVTTFEKTTQNNNLLSANLNPGAKVMMNGQIDLNSGLLILNTATFAALTQQDLSLISNSIPVNALTQDSLQAVNNVVPASTPASNLQQQNDPTGELLKEFQETTDGLDALNEASKTSESAANNGSSSETQETTTENPTIDNSTTTVSGSEPTLD